MHEDFHERLGRFGTVILEPPAHHRQKSRFDKIKMIDHLMLGLHAELSEIRLEDFFKKSLKVFFCFCHPYAGKIGAVKDGIFPHVAQSDKRILLRKEIGRLDLRPLDILQSGLTHLIAHRVKQVVDILAVMLVTIVYNMADLIFVGQTGDAAQVAAVSLASPFFLLQMTLGTLIGGGGCTAISTALGAKDTDRVKACFGACAALCLMSGVLLGSAMLLFPDAFLRLFGADSATWQFTKDYLLVLAVGTPTVVFSSAFANLVRAEGAVKEAVLFNGLGTVTNIVLDPILISGCKMGVQGGARYGSARRRACRRVAVSSKKTAGCACPVK